MSNKFDGKPCVIANEDSPEYSLHLEFAIKKPLSYRSAKYLVGLFRNATYEAMFSVKARGE